MNQKSANSQTTDVTRLTAGQAAELSTQVKIETKKINSRPKPGLNPVLLKGEVDEQFVDIDSELEALGGMEDMSRRIYEVNGKKYRIRQLSPWSLWQVVGNGSLPSELRGSFTNIAEVEKALSIWMAHESTKTSKE